MTYTIDELVNKLDSMVESCMVEYEMSVLDEANDNIGVPQPQEPAKEDKKGNKLPEGPQTKKEAKEFKDMAQSSKLSTSYEKNFVVKAWNFIKKIFGIVAATLVEWVRKAKLAFAKGGKGNWGMNGKNVISTVGPVYTCLTDKKEMTNIVKRIESAKKFDTFDEGGLLELKTLGNVDNGRTFDMKVLVSNAADLSRACASMKAAVANLKEDAKDVPAIKAWVDFATDAAKKCQKISAQVGKIISLAIGAKKKDPEKRATAIEKGEGKLYGDDYRKVMASREGKLNTAKAKKWYETLQEISEEEGEEYALIAKFGKVYTMNQAKLTAIQNYGGDAHKLAAAIKKGYFKLDKKSEKNESIQWTPAEAAFILSEAAQIYAEYRAMNEECEDHMSGSLADVEEADYEENGTVEIDDDYIEDVNGADDENSADDMAEMEDLIGADGVAIMTSDDGSMEVDAENECVSFDFDEDF